MFVQIIQGRVRDAGQLKVAMDRWGRDLSPGATGWINSTGGVTNDGVFFGLVGFTDENSARHNNDRPEQDRWWHDTEPLFDGVVTFHDSREVLTDNQGDPYSAQFVQVMQGRGTDHDRAVELMVDGSRKWKKFRPEILGQTACAYGDGEFTVAVYFTNERDARAGEKRTPPPDLSAEVAELQDLLIGELTYFDLHQPWIQAP